MARLRVKRHATFGQHRKELAADVELHPRRDQIQHLGLEDVDAGAGKARQGLFRLGLFLEGRDAALFVRHHDAVVLDLFQRHLEGDHAGHGLLGLVFKQGRLDVQVDDGVTAHHDGGVVKKAAEVLNALHAAGRAHGLGHDLAMLTCAFERITDLDAPTVAVAKVVLDFPVVERHVHHDLLYPIAAQVLDQVLHHRLAQNGHHRFGDVLGQRPDPGSLPRRQNHCFCHGSITACLKRARTGASFG